MNDKKKVWKNTTLHVQHTFLYISLSLLCPTTTWNFQKFPTYTFYWGNVCIPVQLFFHCRPFSPWCMAGNISHFLTTAVTFSCFSTNGIGLLCCFLFLALSSFSLFHVNVDIWIWSKERLGFVVVSYSLKVRVAMRFTAKNVLCRSLSRCSSLKLSLPHVIFTLLSFVDITGNDFAIKLQI